VSCCCKDSILWSGGVENEQVFPLLLRWQNLLVSGGHREHINLRRTFLSRAVWFCVPVDEDLFLGAKLLSGSPFSTSFSPMTGGAGGVESAVLHRFRR
jgi:hypothetical protein